MIQRMLSMQNRRPKNLAHIVLTLAAVTCLLSATSCKKAPATVQPNGAKVALPNINTTGAAFGGQPWAERRTAAERNVSVGAGKSFARITYKPEVKVIDKATVDASIQGISSDGHGVVFKNAAPEIRALKAGDIFLVKNAFAAKVLAAETDGEQTVIITDQAKLVDVVQQGEISVDSPVSFHGPKVSSASAAPPQPFRLRDLVETPVYAQSGIIAADPGKNLKDQAVGMLISGWKVTNWSVTPGDNSASLAAGLAKDTSGFKSVVSVDGTITNFQFVSDLNFPGSGGTRNLGTQVMEGVQGMSGKMHFVWEIGKGTPGVWAQEDKLSLPVGLSIPLGPVLDGLPLSIGISAAFLIHPALTGGDEYSKGGFTIGWVGSQSGAAQGGDGTEGLTFAITDDQSISPIAPNAMVISFCAPRVELKLGLLGSYGSSTFLQVAAATIDVIVDAIEVKLLPPAAYQALKASPLSNMTATNVLTSSADIYFQVLHTEGVTHASNITVAPCSKIELKVTGQSGGDAQLFGLTPGAKTSKDAFTKTFTRWNPATNFCKSV
jgi:hypothetical protein